MCLFYVLNSCISISASFKYYFHRKLYGFIQLTQAADNCEVNIHCVHMYMQSVAHVGTEHHTNKPVICKKKKGKKEKKETQ